MASRDLREELPNRQRSSRSRSPVQEDGKTRNHAPGGDIKENAKNTTARMPTQTDVILAMQEPYMQQIVTGEKTYEFRKYCLKQSIKRIWFYRTAPYSSIEYVCEILPAKTRNPGDLPLEEDGLGNREFNTRHEDWEGYDFAYKILSVYKIDKPVTLKDLINDHGMNSAPRGLVYTPSSLVELVQWQTQDKLR